MDRRIVDCNGINTIRIEYWKPTGWGIDRGRFIGLWVDAFTKWTEAGYPPNFLYQEV